MNDINSYSSLTAHFRAGETAQQLQTALLQIQQRVDRQQGEAVLHLLDTAQLITPDHVNVYA